MTKDFFFLSNQADLCAFQVFPVCTSDFVCVHCNNRLTKPLGVYPKKKSKVKQILKKIGPTLY